MNEIENRIIEIDQEMEELKGKTTEELTKRLLKSSAESAALYYLLRNAYLKCSRKQAPVPLPTLEAQAYRNDVEKHIGNKISLPLQISALRQERLELRSKAKKRDRQPA